MKNQTILLGAFLLLALVVMLGVVLPTLVSSSNTTVVLGGFGILFAMLVGTVMAINTKFFKKKEEKQ